MKEIRKKNRLNPENVRHSTFDDEEKKNRKKAISPGLKRTSNCNRMLDLYKYEFNVRYKKKYCYESYTKPVYM